MKNNLRIISSNDGSHTIYREDIDEHYHSIHGSIQESIHVFIEAGLKTFIEHNKKKEVNILEIGFGTALNAFISLLEAEKLKLAVSQNLEYIKRETLTNVLCFHQKLEAGTEIVFDEIRSKLAIKKV